MGAVRMTQRGKWVNPNAKRYLDYKQVIALEAKKKFREPFSGPIEVVIHFYLKPPKKMPKGRTAPTVKPDIDNLVKGVFDALNKIAWNDDAQVVKLISHKLYADEPRIEVSVWTHS